MPVAYCGSGDRFDGFPRHLRCPGSGAVEAQADAAAGGNVRIDRRVESQTSRTFVIGTLVGPMVLGNVQEVWFLNTCIYF